MPFGFKNLITPFAAALSAACLTGIPANAATIVVNSFDDSSGCTLRKAVENANVGGLIHAECGAGTAGSNTIQLSAGTYTLRAPALNLFGNAITFTGSGMHSTFIDGQNATRLFDNYDVDAIGLDTAIAITFENLTLRRGNGQPGGDFDGAGAVYVDQFSTLNVRNVAMTGNRAQGSGGAVFNMGTAYVESSSFSGNAAGTAREGGAIHNMGQLTVVNSTFNGNTAGSGGAIAHAHFLTERTLDIANSTFHANTASGSGGAIAVPAGAGAVTLTHVTVAGNTAQESGGGLFNGQGSAFGIDRSIVAGNTANAGADCGGTFNALGYSVIGTASGCDIGGATGTNRIGPAFLNGLADNGGATQTLSLQANSPARDLAPACATASDQRGAARPKGRGCDAGAFEADPVALQAPAGVRSDVNGDGRSDVVWYHEGVYGLIAMPANGLSLDPLFALDVQSDANWKVAGIADLNADGKSDVVWYNAATGAVYGLLMDGGTVLAERRILVEANLQWRVQLVADTDGDGKADIVWRNSGSGEVYVMKMDGLAAAGGQVVYSVADPNWKIVAAGDMNGDGRADILWRNSSTGGVYALMLDGYTVLSQGAIHTEPSAYWKIVGLADHNGDGRADILWRNDDTGDVYMMQMNGTAISAQQVVYNERNPDWAIVAVGDYNGDGRADILWRNAETGDVYMMLMNGFAISSQGVVYTEADRLWRIVGP